MLKFQGILLVSVIALVVVSLSFHDISSIKALNVPVETFLLCISFSPKGGKSGEAHIFLSNDFSHIS